MQTSLSTLKCGEKASVLWLACDRRARRRLQEMGLVAGATVRCIRWAPLGGAVQLETRGFWLALGEKEAAAVIVERED